MSKGCTPPNDTEESDEGTVIQAVTGGIGGDINAWGTRAEDKKATEGSNKIIANVSAIMDLEPSTVGVYISFLSAPLGRAENSWDRM